MTLFLPKNFPSGPFFPWDYAFEYNDTHIAVALDYGSIINHHESPNAEKVWLDAARDTISFAVRRGVFDVRIATF